MILILSDRQDTTVRRVLPKIERLGVPVTWWDSGEFPARSRVTAVFAGGSRRLTLDTGAQVVDLATVTAVWNLRPNRSVAAANVSDPTHRAHVEWQSRFHLDGVWEIVRARWLPCPHPVTGRTRNRLVHTALAAELGFAVPETVYTNDPAELVPAYERAGGRLLVNLLDPEDLRIDGQDHRVHSTLVRRRHLASRHRLQHEPVILQPCLPRAVDLRAVVVGDRVFAVRVGERPGDGPGDFAVHRLPEEVERRCAALAASLGLSYAVVHLALTGEGEHVFLEIDPNGAWAPVEESTGLPVSDAIAAWLAA
ncbi:MvdC/MvdD family ATP grasp protein [Microbispora sp. NPDC046973]|uniref:MvdC/MvdD family ATP grasp protein n=1 Tax=Microbispora sp. NPDC046973 TaxID=3155022 RepID=UPI0033EED109